MKEGREGGMKCTLFFLYLGFNLLNISKTAAPDSSVRGSRFVPSALQHNQMHTAHPVKYLKQLTQQAPVHIKLKEKHTVLSRTLPV